MALPIIIPNTTAISWEEIRKGLRDCIQAVAPDARVYSRWPMKYDIGQTINLLQSSKDNGRVHAWIMGVSDATSYSTKTGGYYLEWDLTIRIWGFLGYAHGVDDNNTQNILEEEARKVAQVIYLNQKHLALDNPSRLEGVEIGFLVFDDIDVQAFGSGDDVHVAQGSLNIRLGERFTVLP